MSHLFTPSKVVDNNVNLCPSWFSSPISTTFLPYPDFLQVYDAIESEIPLSLIEWGNAAGIIIDEVLNRNAGGGALLLRNLTFISTSKEFSVFWKSCCNSSALMDPAYYVPFGANREQDDRIYLATNIPANKVFSCHNEMAYNPKPPGKIALFCVQDAFEGGESILAQNNILTKMISMEVKDFTKAHGGVAYVRKYHDADKPVTSHQKGSFMSWQDKCQTGLKGIAAAVLFFLDLGFKEADIQFDPDNNLTVKFIHPGFIIGDDGEENWFNIVDTGFFTTADGTPYPKELIEGMNNDKWKAVSALKLKPGDWLICDNRKVQHGRLPYTNLHIPGTTYELLTVYTK
jgi:hypothetical protein